MSGGCTAGEMVCPPLGLWDRVLIHSLRCWTKTQSQILSPNGDAGRSPTHLSRRLQVRYHITQAKEAWEEQQRQGAALAGLWSLAVTLGLDHTVRPKIPLGVAQLADFDYPAKISGNSFVPVIRASFLFTFMGMRRDEHIQPPYLVKLCEAC